jgi:hypothetical protein
MRFEVADLGSDVATSLARELRNELVKAGVDPAELSFLSKDKSNMNVGEILQFISSDILSYADKGITLLAVAHGIYNFVHRHDVTIVVEKENRKVRIPPSIVNASEIQKAIQEIADDNA